MDKLISISSMVIALCAFGFTTWQTFETQKYNRLSFRPNLTSWKSTENGHLKFELMNNGLGPATIESFLISIDGKLINGENETSITEAITLLFPNNIYSYAYNYSYITKGYSLAPKDKITIVDINFTDEDGKLIPTRKIIEDKLKEHDVEIFIKYKSLYEEQRLFSTLREPKAHGWEKK